MRLNGPKGGVNFYVSLTITLGLADSGKLFKDAERGLFATEIGSAATGILAVFPACTSRRRHMYIYTPRNLLIINIAIKRRNARCASPLLHSKDNTFFSVFQIAINTIYQSKKGKTGRFLPFSAYGNRTFCTPEHKRIAARYWAAILNMICVSNAAGCFCLMAVCRKRKPSPAPSAAEAFTLCQASWRWRRGWRAC